MISKELDDKLCGDFPYLYQNRNKSMYESAMYWGFSCGDGWFDLIYQLSRKLEPYKVIAAQVKQKWCQLRFHIEEPHKAPPEVLDLIKATEIASLNVCERCGGLRSGKFAGIGAGRATCEECNNE